MMAVTKTTVNASDFTHVKNCNFPAMRLALRPDRGGAESDLVRRFLTEISWEVPSGNHLTVFEQPRLESGFPDIVFVLWDKTKTAGWPDQRTVLTPFDVRIAHHLVTSRPEKLSELLKMFGRSVLDSIGRLSAAKMVHPKMDFWSAGPLERIFAVTQIIAFEAKVDAPAQALAQASRNRWFASHSYIILPKKPRDDRPIKKANQFGVGVWSLQTNKWICQVPSAIETIPRSYASWLFNEWVWRLPTAESRWLSESSLEHRRCLAKPTV